MTQAQEAALLRALPARLPDIVRRWAKETPDRMALVQDGHAIRYGRLSAAIDDASTLLREQGVRPGDRVMIVAENCIAQVVLLFAVMRLDAWVVNVNARLTAAELDNIRSHCQPRLCFYTTGISVEASGHAQRDGAARFMLPDMPDIPACELCAGSLNTLCEPEPVHADSKDQVAALIYTSGTTGKPKGVMLTHRNLLFIAATSSGVRGMTATDRAYGVLPITHVFGLASMLMATLYAGASLYLAARYRPDALMHAISHEGITMLQGVPAMYARLLESDCGSWQPADSALRFIYAGGSPLDMTLKHNVEALFGRTLHNGYGQTETSPTVSQTRMEAPRDDTSVGPVVPGVQIRVVDKSGREAPAGEAGELWVRGPNIMKGYYRDPALTLDTIHEGGWLGTGDMARLDSDGALFIIGRSKELIIRSGFNVYPVEVEAALNAHPAVVQSAVVGCPADEGNEEVVAFVELDPDSNGLDTRVLDAWLEQKLSPYKRPSLIVVMQTMPAASTGKILKHELKQMAQRLRHPDAPMTGANNHQT